MSEAESNDPARRGQNTPLLEQVRTLMPELSPSERKVALHILARPHAAMDQAIGVIAAAADVSEPTVVRFCKRLGYRGVQGFKMALARSLATGLPPTPMGLESDEPLEELAAKVMDRQIATLIHTRNQLPHDRLERAIDLLAGASRIELFGHGASGLVAQDAQHKFFRLGMPVAAYTDPHNHAISATVTPRDAVIIAISHTGRSGDLLQSLRVARDRGVPVIGITAPGTPLAHLASVTLNAEVDEDTDIYTPMLSRLAHLALLDVLAVGVALRGGSHTQARLARIKQTLNQRREIPDSD
ncbi:SIS domain-containing protein [Spiribacter insolitus]|uniref:SIS domain-containing protein n=1 Tax=Spiribacter insolitus TaxID=3122417 RepID=A0ABV3T8V5_9GAMM